MGETIRDVENRRAIAENWGTSPEIHTLGELFLTFVGIALGLSVAAPVVAYVITFAREL